MLGIERRPVQLARRWEANPSGSEYPFDVAALFPRRRFARIVGSFDQDPDTNDGSRLGSTLTLVRWTPWWFGRSDRP